MVYKTCSVNKVIAKIFRDFQPSHSGWVSDAVEWIGDAIDIMKAGGSYGELSKLVEVIDYRAKLPCDLESLLGISYNGMRLPRSGGFNHKNLKNACVNFLPVCGNESYTLNPNYVNTSFQDGCITVYYMGIETDCEGYPMVVDDAIYREALGWYVLMKMLGRGFKHQTFVYADAEARWLKMYPQARNRCKMPDIDGYQLFKKSWLGAVRSNDPTTVFFNSDAYKQDTEAHPPGDVLQTFQIIGEKEEPTESTDSTSIQGTV